MSHDTTIAVEKNYLKFLNNLCRKLLHLSQSTTLTIGLCIVLGWIFLAIFAPWIAPYDPITQDLTAQLAPMSWHHWLGTDNFGRDILSRILFSARVDIQICILGVIFPFMIGTILGALSGYFGGWVDSVLMRVIDVVLAFPFLVLMLAIITILGPGLSSFYIAMALVGWVSYARIVRARVLVLKQSDFIMAVKSLGYSHTRIIFIHVLPNVIADAIVFSMSDAVLVLLNGAAISYLGLGVQPPVPEWGVMVTEGQGFITTNWWLTAFPGIAIVLLAIGFSFIADGLSDRRKGV